ncbi:MAG: hypothetical protein WAV45_11225 [Propionibacteriaceae bacterium]|nr:hypothetical protein [Micropruina sp.]
MIKTIPLGTFNGLNEGSQELLAKVADYVRRKRIGFHAGKYTTGSTFVTP